MDKNINPFEILQVSPRATDEEIKLSFHQLLKVWHPDLHVEDRDAATEQTKLITAAYRMLSQMNESDRMYLYRTFVAKSALQRKNKEGASNSDKQHTFADERTVATKVISRNKAYKLWCEVRKKRKKAKLQKTTEIVLDTEEVIINTTTTKQTTTSTKDTRQRTDDTTNSKAASNTTKQSAPHTKSAPNKNINASDTVATHTAPLQDVKPVQQPVVNKQQPTVDTAQNTIHTYASNATTAVDSKDNAQPPHLHRIRMPKPPRYTTPHVTLTDTYHKTAMYNVDNRKIVRIGYDVMSSTMFVEWKNKKVWALLEVPTILFVQMQHAKDILKFWKENIKSKYTQLNL